MAIVPAVSARSHWFKLYHATHVLAQRNELDVLVTVLHNY